MTMIEAVVKIKAAGGERVGGKLNIIYLQRESQIERAFYLAPIVIIRDLYLPAH
jgi:hypothetical protein